MAGFSDQHADGNDSMHGRIDQGTRIQGNRAVDDSWVLYPKTALAEFREVNVRLHLRTGRCDTSRHRLRCCNSSALEADARQ